MQWYRVDLHLHTPASADYQEPEVSYLDILRRAEVRGLDIVAFTDHNTVNGYAAMMTEIRELMMLVQRDRALPDEKRRLAEYRRLLDKILVLPGFEFTATFGFHILGVFSPDTPVRQIEHILLSLHIPPQTLDEGTSVVGASADVLTSYRTINEVGGVVIAAHANSTHGVAMRGFDFGGQTRIAYTQDPYLHCLEVTDLDRRGRGTTARFFDGSKPEYPRRMRCIQGSDAHRLTRDVRNEKNLGIGDRITEVLLPDRSFSALREMFRSNDFARSRPYRGGDKDVYDYVQVAREAGPSIVQAFHDSLTRQAGRLYAIIADVCAFANTNGGTIYIGASPDLTVPPVGVNNIGEAIDTLRNEIEHRVNPPLDIEIDALETQGKALVRIQVPRGDDPPYAIDDNKIYVRDEADTSLAVRDEIVQLVRKNVRSVNGEARAEIAQPASIADHVSEPARAPGVSSKPASEGIAAATQAPELFAAMANRDNANGAPHDAGESPLAAPAEPAPASSSTGRRTRRGRAGAGAREASEPATPTQSSSLVVAPAPPTSEGPPISTAPRTGVEIIGTETRKGQQYHIMRDLRNGSIVKNVTRTSARRLWHYAIMEQETNPVNLNSVQWNGDIGLWKRYRRGGVVRYDLVQSEAGHIRIYYGVTEEGMHGPWQNFITDEVEDNEEMPGDFIGDQDTDELTV